VQGTDDTAPRRTGPDRAIPSVERIAVSDATLRAPLVVVALEPDCLPRAALLADALALPLLGYRAQWRGCDAHASLLLVGADGLSLGTPGRGRTHPVRVDFAAPELLHRIRQGGARRESVARALGLPAPRMLRVVDATAGLGRDSAVLAALGCEVTMIERQPVVAALLADGLERARADAREAVRGSAARLALRTGDARLLLEAWQGPAPDAVLLDPMFPGRESSAAVRREMRVFQQLVGDDADAPALLAAAIGCARFRVAVKRPRGAPPLAGPRPSHTLEGSSTRFDVYVRARIV
jgi:16S rRNA (guanine1516-N2)-methyltransferase